MWETLFETEYAFLYFISKGADDCKDKGCFLSISRQILQPVMINVWVYGVYDDELQ